MEIQTHFSHKTHKKRSFQKSLPRHLLLSPGSSTLPFPYKRNQSTLSGGGILFQSWKKSQDKVEKEKDLSKELYGSLSLDSRGKTLGTAKLKEVEDISTGEISLPLEGDLP